MNANDALYKALSEDDLTSFKGILASGDVDLNYKYQANPNPASYCSILHFAYTRIEFLLALIDAGADVNIKDSKGWTPLYEANLARDHAAVVELIAAGAEVNIPGINPNYFPTFDRVKHCSCRDK